MGVRFYLARQTPGALQVTTTPKSQVFIDGQLIGQTPLLTNTVRAGEHTVKITPMDNGLKSSFEQKLFFSSRLLTAIDATFRDTDTQGEISILTLEPITDGKNSQVAVLSTPQEATVSLDGELKGVTPIQLKDIPPSDHEIILEKSGLQTKRVRIKTSAGYKLMVNVKLALLEQQTVASPSSTPTPIPKQETVIIKQTPTGFLRVRFSPTLAATEVARVKPGDTFSLLEEETNWVKILLPDNRTGWVSSHYVSKP